MIHSIKHLIVFIPHSNPSIISVRHSQIDGTKAECQADVSSVVWCRGERVLCSVLRMRLGGSPNSHCFKSPVEVQTLNKNHHCVAFQQHRTSVLTDIVFASPMLCIFRMIIVWHIQYVNIIIVRGRGPVIMEQEMTCQDPWWPQRGK